MRTIKEGDIVEVMFSRKNWFRGKVLYVPCATGDSWQIEDLNGRLHVVNTFQEMIVLPKGFREE